MTEPSGADPPASGHRHSIAYYIRRFTSRSHSTMENDTETLLVMLSSLLPESHQNLDQEALLEALLECEGDVEEAAAKLTSQSSSRAAGSSNLSTKNKRKRRAGLDGWLQNNSSTPSKRVNSGDKSARARSVSVPVDDRDRQHPSPGTSLKVKGTGKPNSTGNAFTRLKPPSTFSTPEVPPQLPPLTLGTPEMVAKHTACTLHPQVLPPELAIELFETMLTEAGTWDRNRFWLFERAVESPHKNSFYVRDMSIVAEYDRDDDISDLEWKEAAHYWYVHLLWMRTRLQPMTRWTQDAVRSRRSQTLSETDGRSM